MVLELLEGDVLNGSLSKMNGPLWRPVVEWQWQNVEDFKWCVWLHEDSNGYFRIDPGRMVVDLSNGLDTRLIH